MSGSQESAASRVFRIPHLLSAIIEIIGCEPMEDAARNVTLLNCMQVNSSWHSEAIRQFWEVVTTGPGKLPFPTLERLLNVGAERRQRCADRIRTLELYLHGLKNPSTNYKISYDSDDDSDDDSEYEGSSLMEIDQLSFPRLENLTIPALTIPQGNRCYWIPLKQFIQPNLKRLNFGVCDDTNYLVSDPFLRQLEQGATGLSHIDVSVQIPQFANVDNVATISKNRMVSFLESFKATLERFHWRIDATISSASFNVLSCCPRLKSLRWLQIQDSWVMGEDFATPTRFPSLKEMENGSISGRALRSLLPSIEAIENLGLYESGDSPSLWKAITEARLAWLSSLSLTLRFDTVIAGDEILTIAYHHPQLQVLKIWPDSSGPNYYYPLMASGFSDTTVTNLAKSLPKLRSLTLRCYNEDYGLLGEDSLTSLGCYCPSLEECHLYANIDWRKVSSEEFSNVIWPKLQFLYLLFHDSNGQTHDTALEFEDPSELGNLLLQRMPAMHKVSARFDDHGQTRNISYALLRIISAKRKEEESARGGT